MDNVSVVKVYGKVQVVTTDLSDRLSVTLWYYYHDYATALLY